MTDTMVLKPLLLHSFAGTYFLHHVFHPPLILPHELISRYLIARYLLKSSSHSYQCSSEGLSSAGKFPLSTQAFPRGSPRGQFENGLLLCKIGCFALLVMTFKILKEGLFFSGKVFIFSSFVFGFPLKRSEVSVLLLHIFLFFFRISESLAGFVLKQKNHPPRRTRLGSFC